MASNPKTNPHNLENVTVVDGYKDIQSKHTASLTASKTIAELLGVAVSEDAAGVVIVTDGGAVNYNPVGEADATHALLPSYYVATGGKAVLDLIELFAAAATTVEVIVFGVND